MDFGQYKTRTADCGLRITDCGLGIKHGLGIKRRLRNIYIYIYIYSRIYENRNIGHQEPTHLKLTQLK